MDHVRDRRVAEALAAASTNGPIANSYRMTGWDGLDKGTQDRLILVARLARKMEEQTR